MHKVFDIATSLLSTPNSYWSTITSSYVTYPTYDIQLVELIDLICGTDYQFVAQFIFYLSLMITYNSHILDLVYPSR